MPCQSLTTGVDSSSMSCLLPLDHLLAGLEVDLGGPEAEPIQELGGVPELVGQPRRDRPLSDWRSWSNRVFLNGEDERGRLGGGSTRAEPRARAISERLWRTPLQAGPFDVAHPPSFQGPRASGRAVRCMTPRFLRGPPPAPPVSCSATQAVTKSASLDGQDLRDLARKAHARDLTARALLLEDRRSKWPRPSRGEWPGSRRRSSRWPISISARLRHREDGMFMISPANAVGVRALSGGFRGSTTPSPTIDRTTSAQIVVSWRERSRKPHGEAWARNRRWKRDLRPGATDPGLTLSGDRGVADRVDQVVLGRLVAVGQVGVGRARPGTSRSPRLTALASMLRSSDRAWAPDDQSSGKVNRPVVGR